MNCYVFQIIYDIKRVHWFFGDFRPLKLLFSIHVGIYEKLLPYICAFNGFDKPPPWELSPKGFQTSSVNLMDYILFSKSAV